MADTRTVESKKPFIYYVTDIPYYYAPKFPLIMGKVPDEFNVLMMHDLKSLYFNASLSVKEKARVQKVIVLSETLRGKCHNMRSGHGGYRRIMDGALYVLPMDNSIYTFAEFMEMKDWKLEGNQAFSYQPNCLTDDPTIVKKFIDYKMPISLVLHANNEIIIYAINKYKENLNHLPSDWINDEIRAEIKTLYNQGKLKDIKLRTEHLYSESRDFTDEEIHILKDRINKTILSSETMSHFEHEDCQNILHDVLNGTVIHKVLSDWLINYHELPNTLSYKLDSIAYADEHHKKNRHWKSHIREQTKAYLNITEACCIHDHESFKNFCENYYQIFNLIIQLGFNLVFHGQDYWRRGTDIRIVKFGQEHADFDPSGSFNPNMYKYNVINIFIHNPHITEDSDDYETCATESDESN